MLADRLAFTLGANLRRGDRPGPELRRRALNGPGHLDVISQYFPGYPAEIGARLGVG